MGSISYDMKNVFTTSKFSTFATFFLDWLKSRYFAFNLFFVPSKNQSIFPRSEFNHDKAEKGQTYNHQMIMMKIFEVKPKYLNKSISEFSLWQYGLWSFQAGGTNLERCQKLSKSFSFFFSLKNINSGAHFLLFSYFDNIYFKSL